MNFGNRFLVAKFLFQDLPTENSEEPKIIAAGIPLQSPEEIDEELRSQRYAYEN